MNYKILHIIDNMWLGWAQTVVKWIFEGQKDNQDIFLYALRKRDINIEIDHKNIYSFSWNNKYSFPIFKLRQFIKNHNIEILHCHLAKSQIIWWILKTFFFPNIKLVFHEHWEILENWKIYPILMNFFRKKVDTYIAVSNAIKQAILDKTDYNDNQVKTLYNFVDLNRFKRLDTENISKKRKKLWYTSSDFIIGWAWRLIERKWWCEFIEVAKRLIDNWYDIKFIIAWDGEDRDKLISNISWYKDIKYIGYHSDMVWFYNIIDIFIFSSHWEPLGLTWIEANACNTSVIISVIPWATEIMIDWVNSMYFNVKDIDNLYDKVLKLYEDKDLRDKLSNNWLEEVKKYSLEKYLVLLNEVYEW